MTQNEVTMQRHAILEEVEAQFKEALIPARITDGTEQEAVKDPRVAHTEVLNVLFENLAEEGTETLGEFFFVPSDPEDEMQIYDILLTLESEIDENMFPELLASSSVLNACIPTGTFAVDIPGRNLVYRHAYELPFPLENEQLSDAIDLCMGVALDVVRNYGYLLLEVADGERDTESIMALVYGGIMSDQR